MHVPANSNLDGWFVLVRVEVGSAAFVPLDRRAVMFGARLCAFAALRETPCSKEWYSRQPAEPQRLTLSKRQSGLRFALASLIAGAGTHKRA